MNAPLHGPIVYLPPTELKPHEHNAREHTESAVERLCQSIRTFGFTNPVLIDENKRILAGHGRVLAAIKIGLSSIPCRTLSGLSEAQARVYVISDNKHTDNSWFDMRSIKAELLDLDTGEIDLTLTGFSQAELADLLGGSSKKPKDDENVSQTELPVSRPGDIWRLGDSYLLVGKGSAKIDADPLTIAADADKVLKAYQKFTRSPAILLASSSNIVDQVITEHAEKLL
jgi:ParB-like chromosome segregation protein Spo0J